MDHQGGPAIVEVSKTIRNKAVENKEKCESVVGQLCLTLCDPTDCSLPGSSVHGMFQATVLEWIAISFSKIKENQVQF